MKEYVVCLQQEQVDALEKAASDEGKTPEEYMALLVSNFLTARTLFGDMFSNEEEPAAPPPVKKNVVLTHIQPYNARRYSKPWVSYVNDGQHSFTVLFLFTGRHCMDEAETEGDVIIRQPIEGQVYGYGQRDNRGNNTVTCYALWNGNEFVPCSRMGKIPD